VRRAAGASGDHCATGVSRAIRARQPGAGSTAATRCAFSSTPCLLARASRAATRFTHSSCGVLRRSAATHECQRRQARDAERGNSSRIESGSQVWFEVALKMHR
jgi:hypothetical protein